MKWPQYRGGLISGVQIRGSSLYSRTFSVKMSLEEAEQDRDSLRYKLSERKREVDRLKEQLMLLGPNQDNTKREITKIIAERDSLRSKLTELKQEKQAVHERLKQANKSIESHKTPQSSVEQRASELQLQVNSFQKIVETTRKEKDEMTEENNDLRRKLEMADMQVRELDGECQR